MIEGGAIRAAFAEKKAESHDPATCARSGAHRQARPTSVAVAPHRRRRPHALGAAPANAPPHAPSSSMSLPAIFSSGRTSLMPQAAIAASGML